MSLTALRLRTSTSNWRTLLGAVCIAQATAIVGFDFTLPFIPLYLQHDLGVHGLAQTALWSGLIGFGPAIPATIFGPLWGRLADRFGYRTMLLRAMLSASVLLTLMGLAPAPAVLFGLRMIQGALTGTVFSAQALVAAAVPEEETARSMGLLQMSVYLGATLGPIGGGAVAQTLGFRAAFVTAGILLAAATTVVYLYVREPARRAAKRSKENEGRSSLLSVLMIPAFAGALVLTLVVQLAFTAMLPVIPLYVQDLLHSGRGVAADTGWVLAASGLTAALGSYSAGRLHRHLGLKPLLLIALILSATLLVPQALVGNFLAFLVLRSAAGYAFGALFGLVGTWAAVSSPSDAKGTAFGLMGAASSLGFGCGPLLGGAITAALGIRPLFILSAILLGLMPVALFAIQVALPRALRGIHAGRQGVVGLLER